MVQDIKASIALRKYSAELVGGMVRQCVGQSEKTLAETLAQAFTKQDNIFLEGWYSPPPKGIAVLADSTVPFLRLNFDSLRRKEFWPSENVITKDSVVIVYVSPVHRASGLIGDYGGTFALGGPSAISEHIQRCEKIMRELAAEIRPTMRFSEVYHNAQDRFRQEHLNNASTVSDTDPNRTNIGHTVPFSFDYEMPPSFNDKETDFRTRISTARRFLNSTEKLRVPNDGVFTFEARLVDETNAALPNAFVHLLVYMQNGQPHVL